MFVEREREREKEIWRLGGRGLDENAETDYTAKMTRAYFPQHGTLVMNSLLPAKTKKKSWPSEGILDELRTRSKTALAVSNVAPLPSASTDAKPAHTSRDEARKEKKA